MAGPRPSGHDLISDSPGVPGDWLLAEAKAGRVFAVLVEKSYMMNLELVRAALDRRAAEEAAQRAGGPVTVPKEAGGE